jgi:UDP-N-acetylmuramate--alanine ligase
MKHALQHLHFVGIGGAGMSAIAEVLYGQGFRITGSDASASDTTRRLAALGLGICIGHDASHIGDAQAVVTSTAVRADNPEVLAARAQGIPVVPRAAALAELLRGKFGIAIAGTHGKTTTTSLVASVLSEAGADPTFVIGGTMLAPRPPAATAPQEDPAGLGRPGTGLLSAGANARLGAGEHVVVEADESDASFLQLSPMLAVVTNIDADHMATYGHSLDLLHTAFVDFLHRLPFYGHAIVCADDPGVQAVMPRVQRPLVTYGLSDSCDVRALDVQALPGGRMQFSVQRRRAGPRSSALPPLALTLNLAGLHNVRNALAAVAVAMLLELPDAALARALAGFAGVGRRFQRHGELPAADGGRFSLIDDYGHHPVEVAAVLQAARGAFPGRRLVLAFQPHRYSRTRDCFDAFASALAGFDAVLLTEVYAAGEAPIAGADGAALHQALASAMAAAGRAAPQWVPAVQALPAAIAAAARDGDVVFTLGAGSIGGVPAQLQALLSPTSAGAMP